MLCFGFLIFMQCQLPGSSTVTVCPFTQERAPAWQQQLGAELRTAGPAVRSMSREWLDLRDQAKACRKRGAKK